MTGPVFAAVLPAAPTCVNGRRVSSGRRPSATRCAQLSSFSGCSGGPVPAGTGVRGRRCRRSVASSAPGASNRPTAGSNSSVHRWSADIRRYLPQPTFRTAGQRHCACITSGRGWYIRRMTNQVPSAEHGSLAVAAPVAPGATIRLKSGISVGAVREADLWDFCGARQRSSAAHVAGHSATRDFGFRDRFALSPRCWAAVELPGLPSCAISRARAIPASRRGGAWGQCWCGRCWCCQVSVMMRS